jgi:8-oxo-dGTP pyrophosphatase MutT (NUDIX family)
VVRRPAADAWLTFVSEIRCRSSREIFANQWLRLREDEIEYPGGGAGRYTVIDKQDFALVVPYAEGGFWLVQQYRYPVSSRQWEFPQGGWPGGLHGSAEELARAELAEETGFRAGRLDHLGRLFTAYGFCSQSYDTYLARELVAGDPDREASEADMVHRWFAEADVRAMIRSGRLRDAHSVAALALFDGFRAG